MSLLHTAVSIFTISNPIGNLPIYLSFTDGNPRKDRAIARSSATTFLIALLLAAWLGDQLLGFFGISQSAFQIAGGLIVVLIGLSMLHSEPSKVHHDPQSVDRDQNSSVKGIVPLGIPLLAGPGTLTVVIADPAASSINGKIAISLVVVLLTVLIYMIFNAAEALSSAISTSALQVLTKIMGLLLTAIAVQMLITGLSSAFPMPDSECWRIKLTTSFKALDTESHSQVTVQRYAVSPNIDPADSQELPVSCLPGGTFPKARFLATSSSMAWTMADPA